MRKLFLFGGGSILMLAVVNFYSTSSAKIDVLLKDVLALAQQESNNDGEGKYFYEHLQGKPDECTLYKAVDASGSVHYGSDESGFETGWTVTKVEGIKELCPDKGDGCTVYSFRITD